jgi:hypothetical protein
MEVLDGALDSAGNHHGPRLPADLPGGKHLFVEVVYDDFGFQADGVIVALDIPAQLFLRLYCASRRSVGARAPRWSLIYRCPPSAESGTTCFFYDLLLLRSVRGSSRMLANPTG